MIRQSSLCMGERIQAELKVQPSRIHRLFYPQVPLVLSAEFEGRISAMPVVSYAAASTSPPLVVVSIGFHSFTLKQALRSRAFSLCVLDKSSVNAIERLALTSGRKVSDKLTACGLSHSRGVKLQVPVIRGAEATLECQVRSKQILGDHVLLVGLVKACYSSRKFRDFWDLEKYKPILYTGWRDGLTVYGAQVV